MNFPEVLQRITLALDHAGIPYMLTGSFASAYYGSLRSTQDIDLVIGATSTRFATFIESINPDEYYCDLDAALEAHKNKSMFNIIDRRTGWKIDIIICKDRPFSKEEFGRRQSVTMEGTALVVATPEDVILAKLEWAKLAQSQRQIDDAAGILRMRSDSLDRAYLDKWVRDLGLEKEWGDAELKSSSP
jgi:hypothetical protein